MENNEVVTAPAAPEAAATSEAAPAQRPFRPMKKRKKVCIFCADKIDYIDYKDTVRLKKLVSERSKILPRRISGTCAVHQRQLTVAIKRARQMALIPYVSD
ncbi:MAG: 30S ribosomal protein S18 [Clostridia bacterium]|nr:30S ribosomal protein S18 [Clostridia bacterium]